MALTMSSHLEHRISRLIEAGDRIHALKASPFLAGAISLVFLGTAVCAGRLHAAPSFRPAPEIALEPIARKVALVRLDRLVSRSDSAAVDLDPTDPVDLIDIPAPAPSEPIDDPPRIRVPPGLIGRYPLSLPRTFGRSLSLLRTAVDAGESQTSAVQIPRVAFGFETLRGITRSFRFTSQRRLTATVALEAVATYYREHESNRISVGTFGRTQDDGGEVRVTEVIPWSLSLGLRAYPISDGKLDGSYFALSAGLGRRLG